MANRQIGWSTESNLLWQIGNQIDRMTGVIGSTLSTFVPQSRTLTINGVTYDLSANRSWTVSGGISGTGAAGQVAYWTGVSSQAGSNNLFWDATNSRLGIRSSSPTGNLEIKTANDLATLRAYPNDDFSSPLHLLRGNNGVVSLNTFTSNGTITSPTDVSASGGILRLTGNIYIDGAYRNVARMEYITTSIPAIGNPPTAIRWLTTNASYSLDERMRLTAAGRLLLGTVTEGTFLLDVNGTARVSGVLSVLNSSSEPVNVKSSASVSAFILDNTNANLWGGNYVVRVNGSDKNYFGTLGSLLGSTNYDATIWATSGNGFRVYTNGNNRRFEISSTGAAEFTSSVTATSFIKSGGTSAQILAADGSVITAGTNITISGGTISSSGGGGGSMAIGGSITSATAGSVLFAGTSGVLAQKNANFFWDNTNNRLGIGTTAPATGLQVNGQITINTTGIAGQSAFISTNKPAISNGNNIFIGNGGSALTAAGSTQAAGLTGVGFQCLQNNTTGESATAVGFQSMTSNTTGNNNSAFGVGAMYSNTTGQQNTALGFNTLNANISGNYNVAIGNEALKGGTANSENVMIGWRNGYVTTTGAYNTGVGSNALLGITSGQLNVGFGWRAAQSVTSGNYNCAFGGQALNSTTGSNNNAFGYSAGQNNTTGSNNIFIGFQTNGVAATDSNRTFIGNSSTTSTWLGGNLLLGSTTDGGQRLQVNGTALITSKLSLSGGTTSAAQINLASSTAPTSPNNGDIWFDGTDLKIRIGGVTKTFTLV